MTPEQETDLAPGPCAARGTLTDAVLAVASARTREDVLLALRDCAGELLATASFGAGPTQTAILAIHDDVAALAVGDRNLAIVVALSGLVHEAGQLVVGAVEAYESHLDESRDRSLARTAQ